MSIRPAFSALLTIASGAVAGTITAAMFSRSAPASTAPVTTPTPSVAAIAVPVTVGDDGLVHALDHRVSALEGARVVPTKTGGPTQPPDLETYRAEHLADHEAAIAKHWASPVDPSWSGKSASSFQKDLGDVASKGKFDVVRVDCRSSSCLGTLEWSSYDDAKRNFENVLVHSYDVNCAREIFLPEPANAQARYQATAVFDCKKSGK